MAAARKGRQYTHLLFDADDTLFDYRRAEKYALEAAFSAIGIAVDADLAGAYAEINHAIWKAYEKKEISQEALRVERFRKLFDLRGIQADPADFSRVYLDALSEGSFLKPGAETVCRRLRAGKTISIITNGIAAVQRRRIGRSSLAPYIDHLIISEEAGANKPDPAIFHYAEKITGQSDKAAMLIIGDSLSSDIAGGTAYGIDTCWYNPDGLPLPGGHAPTYTIKALEELLDLLA